MQSAADIIKDRNIEFDTAFDPVSKGGFTQVPNFILEDPTLSIGAKVIYAMFLRYAWHNEQCFPGQKTLGEAIGMCRTSVTQYVNELDKAGLITVQRRGQGRTNLYTIRFQVISKVVRKNKARTSRSQYTDF